MKYSNAIFIVCAALALVGLSVSCENTLNLLNSAREEAKNGENPGADTGNSGPDTEFSGDLDRGEAIKAMQDFIMDISRYSRGKKPNFIIIPQNGEKLAFNNAEPKDGVYMDYLNAIDGIGVEELFYDGDFNEDTERLRTLRQLKRLGKKIMVADYVEDDANFLHALDLSDYEEFIAFPRRRNNYDYEYIPAPSDIKRIDTNNITELKDALNYLYLISDSRFKTKNDLITAIKGTNYDVVILDAFFKGRLFTPADIEAMRYKPIGGRRLFIAYISAGSAETYRDYFDEAHWSLGNPEWLKAHYDGYEDEFWVQYWHPQWRNIVFGGPDAWIDQIIGAGFDGAYLDNVEAYSHVAN